MTAIPPAWIEQVRPGGTILTNRRGRLMQGAQVRLTVRADGTASGRFLPGYGSFMALRHDPTCAAFNPHLRQLIHVGAFNLSLIFRSMIGAGTPRELKNHLALLVFVLERLMNSLRNANGSSTAPVSPRRTPQLPHHHPHLSHCHLSKRPGSATDC